MVEALETLQRGWIVGYYYTLNLVLQPLKSTGQS